MCATPGRGWRSVAVALLLAGWAGIGGAQSPASLKDLLRNVREYSNPPGQPPRQATPPRPLRDPYAYAESQVGEQKAMAAAAACHTQAAQQARTGHGVADARCRLVAYEVCMNHSLGIVSQSQDSARQCAIVQGLAGVNACSGPCTQAARLPRGGTATATVHGKTYSELTSFAPACVQDVMRLVQQPSACERALALQCLTNASASDRTRQAIRADREAACLDAHRENPQAVCRACTAAPRVDVDAGPADRGETPCTPALALAGRCVIDQAARLPRGGSHSVTTAQATYTGLTPFAERCHRTVVERHGGTQLDACARSEALQCLINASANPEHNEAIRAERQRTCQAWAASESGRPCAACEVRPAMVYDDSSRIDLEPALCTRALAQKGLCLMPEPW